MHTQMWYSEFNDVLRVIEKMDADVVSIENARSGSELLEGFKEYRYPNEIGPGVYDIHSPRVPSTTEIVQAVKRIREVLDDRQIWVNPDCGFKTRGWEETLAALRHMVQAARPLRPLPASTPGEQAGVETPRAWGHTSRLTPGDIRITAEPLPTRRGKFLASVPVHTGGVPR